MTLAYRIVDWKKLYEVTAKGKPAKEESTVDELRKSPLPYVRWAVHGHSLGPTYRKMVKRAWDFGILMEMACMGIFGKLLELAADQEPKYRGWILDEKQRPIKAPQIAELLDIRDDGTFEKLLGILCHEEINWVEWAEFPQQAGENRGEKGREGERSDSLGGKVEEPLYKVNETETEEKENYNYETERGFPDFPAGVGIGVSLPPPSALNTGSVSEISASVSDSAPRGGAGIKKRKAEAIFQLSRIIPARGSSDRTTFRDIFDQLEQRMIYETDEPLFKMAMKKARESCLVGRVPAAVFTEAMKKKPFCYVPKGTSTIRGKTDKYHN